MIMAIKKRKHPQFLRPNSGRSSRSRIKKNWRRPRGIDNKKRLKIKYMGASPSIGYGQPAATRGFHPRGKPEVLVQSPSELENLKDIVIRIASGVGRLKREAIQKLAASKGLHVANPKKFEPKQKRMEKKERKKLAEQARKGEAPKPAPAEQPKAEQQAAPTAESSAKLASQAASQSQQSQQHRHDKQI